MKPSYRMEPLSETLQVCVSPEHGFGTDAFLLTDFSRYRRKDLVCDLGTGCGIIPMIMQRQDPPKQVYGVDIQPQAIEQFQQSVQASGVSHVTPICADLRTLWAGAPMQCCDLVTCNPPYKAQSAGIESAITAQRIARHEILCNIGDVCRAANQLLKFGGRLCICNRPERLADVVAAMQQNGIEPKRLRFVAKNPESAPWLFLMEGRKGGKPFLSVLPQLHVREGSGYTEEMRRLYRLPEQEASN